MLRSFNDVIIIMVKHTINQYKGTDNKLLIILNYDPILHEYLLRPFGHIIV